MTKIISIHSELSKILQSEDNTLTNCANIRTRQQRPRRKARKISLWNPRVFVIIYSFVTLLVSFLLTFNYDVLKRCVAFEGSLYIHIHVCSV